jgi:O-antigen biosynthesis protein WbqP
VKRIFDFFFSILLLLLLSPVLLVLAGIINATSRGPVLFKQYRVGLHKKEFIIYKFRTMHQETPEDKPTHLLENPDMHITSVGRILRKTSLDELPQLLNIIRGDMSFIGPRPALYNQYDLTSLRDQYHVHNMRPGITGWAQINGRDELEVSVKAEYDRYYVDNYSLWLDIRILFRTVVKVIMAHGVVEGVKADRFSIDG